MKAILIILAVLSFLFIIGDKPTKKDNEFQEDSNEFGLDHYILIGTLLALSVFIVLSI